MSILGLDEQTTTQASDKKAQSKATSTSQKSKTSNDKSDEAKAMLAKMKAKNDNGDCAFC